MVDFRKKTIGPKDAFGAVLRRRRESLGATLGTVAKKIGIQRHYLAALEEGRYGELPGVVYGKSFVRVYGAFLGLSVAPLLRAFADEYTLVRVTRAPKKEAPIHDASLQALITPFRMRVALAASLFLILGLYFGGEVAQVLRAPTLTVVSPDDQLVTHATDVRVAGTVDEHASLMVNDVLVNHEQGVFTAIVPLEEGMNVIHIRAFRRHGKETTIVRNVLRSPQGISLK